MGLHFQLRAVELTRRWRRHCRQAAVGLFSVEVIIGQSRERGPVKWLLGNQFSKYQKTVVKNENVKFIAASCRLTSSPSYSRSLVSLCRAHHRYLLFHVH